MPGDPGGERLGWWLRYGMLLYVWHYHSVLHFVHSCGTHIDVRYVAVCCSVEQYQRMEICGAAVCFAVLD